MSILANVFSAVSTNGWNRSEDDEIVPQILCLPEEKFVPRMNDVEHSAG